MEFTEKLYNISCPDSDIIFSGLERSALVSSSDNQIPFQGVCVSEASIEGSSCTTSFSQIVLFSRIVFLVPLKL